MARRAAGRARTSECAHVHDYKCVSSCSPVILQKEYLVRKSKSQYRSDPELLYPINKATFDVSKMNKSKTQRAKRAELTWSTRLPQSRKTVFLFIIFIAQSSFLNYPHSHLLPVGKYTP